MLIHKHIFHQERKGTTNYDLANTQSQGLIVFGKPGTNFRTYIQFEFLVMDKHVHAMHNFFVMMTNVYKTPPSMATMYY